jgi:hypothetical protein
VVFRLPVSLVDGQWELNSPRGIRFDAAYDDGVTFAGNNFVINRRGISDKAGSIHLVNARGGTKEIVVTLGGAVRVF